MGYDYAEVDDYLEEKGLCEMRHELLVETLKNPHFRNPLFIPPNPEPEKQNYNYGMYQPNQIPRMP